jgi:hypothetical protein
MKVFTLFQEMVQYISEAAVSLFKPSNDQYPAVGVQPFEGEPYSKWVEASRPYI